MARIKKFSPKENLSSFQTFIVDEGNNSDYFRITEFKDTFTGGKNGFLIEGSEYLKESTEIKVEILDVNGDPIYYEPGNGIPEYYEGISKLIAVYVYNDTPIGNAKITILGELKQYIDETGVIRQIPTEWEGAYNVKWEREFKVNKLLSNEDRVRFYRRPEVQIDEIVKPIFNINPPLTTQSGSVNGLPLVPNENVNLSDFTLPTSYRLKVASGNGWTGSMDNQIVSFDNLNYSPRITEVVNETELIVSPPYSENNIVKSFNNEDYSITFNHTEGLNDLATALTGSFAKISITDMKTFVGDAARVKVFRRSQSQLTDFEFVQEIQLESNELLRDIETKTKTEETYGLFTQDNLDEYWNTSTSEITAELNQDFLYNSVKLSGSQNQYFFTTQSFNVQNDVEYTLDFNVRYSGSINPNDSIRFFLSGSYNGNSKSQDITTVNSSTFILQKTNFNENIIADNFDSAKLYIEPIGSTWHLNNISLKASQETSFSPDEITFIQQVPKTLEAETFDYRFEFYDINNNFIPVRVEESKTFVGGNLNLFQKSIEVTPDNLYFSFDSASAPANPLPPTVINFDVETNVITGSITYTSGAFDFFGNEISSSEYAGGQYPGLLSNIVDRGGKFPFLTVQNFTGSRDDLTVQFIRYTAEVEGVSDTFVITRVEDGKGGVSHEIVPYRGTIIKNKESKTLELQAVRVDGINRIDLRDGLTRNFSDAKLHLASASIDGVDEVTTYVSLSQAITNPDFITGIFAGTTGSGEIDYNAEFTRDAIDNELVVYLMDGPTTSSILTSLILTDLKDGLNNGIISSTAEQFNIKYVPRETNAFSPVRNQVTASFQKRGTTLNPVSASLDIIPSSSIEPKTEVPHFYMFYETGAFDDTITVAVTDVFGNSIDSGIPGITPGIAYYDAVETKQLNLEFTYTEPITSASVTANKTFFITPDGLPGRNSINIEIEPSPVQIGANHKGDVYDYTVINPTIEVTQGDLFLIHTASGDPGTFTTSSVNGIVPTGITLSGSTGDNSTSMSLYGFSNMNALSASVQYNFDIYPYFTSSFVTQSKIQRFNKVIEGTSAIEILIDPPVVNFNADELGYVTDYVVGNTDIVVRQQEEYLAYDYSNAGTPGTYTASFEFSNINFNQISESNQYGEISGADTLHLTEFNNMSATSASIVYNFTVYPYSLKNGVAGVPTNIVKKQIFTRTSDGTSARKVNLLASSNTVVYNGDGTKVSPEGNITLTANAINNTGSAYFEFLYDDNSTLQASSTFNETTLGSSDLPNTGSQSTFKVNLRDGSSDGTIVDTDSITITGVQAGSNAFTTQLSNPSTTVLVEVDGTTYFENSTTEIHAYKGGNELQFVEEYDEEAIDPITFLPIGTDGQFSASIFEISPSLTHRSGSIISQSGELYGVSAGVSNWNTPQANTTGYIIYKIDFENGRATQYVQQSFSTVFEGAVGPGIVVRGEWTGSLEYLYTPERRDVVIYRYDNSGTEETHYFATTDTLVTSSTQPYTNEPVYTPGMSEGTYDTNNWEYLGEQDFFVAAKMAIFEESFVENTINVGIPQAGDGQNANIAIVGGSDEPYIAIGQNGTQGYAQPGVFLGLTRDGGPLGGSGTSGLLSVASGTDGQGRYNSLEWNGETLTIRGAINQTSAGIVAGSLRGLWAVDTIYYPDDVVTNEGQGWIMDGEPHTSSLSHEPGTGVSYAESWSLEIPSGSSGTSGTDGAVGEPAGITYAGRWTDNIASPTLPYENGVTYMGEQDLRYVVKYDDGSGDKYYACSVTHTPRGIYDASQTYVSEDAAGNYVPDVVRKNLVFYKVKAGQGPVTGVTPSAGAPSNVYWEQIGSSITPGTWTDGWEQFGAQFTAVATDILFAEDVYANKTINVGTDDGLNPVIAINADSASGYQNPFISIGQGDDAGFEKDGIYLGYSDTSASFSILSDVGTKINLGGLNVDRAGLFFTETVELSPFTQVSTQRLFMRDTGSGFTFPPEIVQYGNVNYQGTDHPVIGYSSSFAVQLSSADYEVSITDWDITYYSGAFVNPFGGPATKPTSQPEDIHGWRDDPSEHPEQAVNESWFLDWRIDKNTTISGYNFTKDRAEGYSYLQLTAGNLADEFSDLTNNRINELRGDSGIFPSVGGGDGFHNVNTVLGAVPTGSVPVLWIDNTQDADQNEVWTSNTRVAYQVIDVVNSTTPADDFDYDTLVLGRRVYPNTSSGNAFEDDFAAFETTYGVSSAVNGVAPTTSGVNINTSIFKNLQLTWHTRLTDSSDNYTDTEMGIGFLRGVPIELETVRLHSSGSNGNTRPFLSMGQTTQSYDSDGLYLGYQEGFPEAVLNLQSDAGYLKWDGENLRINGTIEAGGLLGTGSSVVGSSISIPFEGEDPFDNASNLIPSFSVDSTGRMFANQALVRGTVNADGGSIGDWVIDEDTRVLRDNNSEVIFDPTTSEIALFNAETGSKTVSIKAEESLASANASGTDISGIGDLGSTPYTSVTQTTYNFSRTYGSYAYGATGSAADTVDNGTYPLTFTMPTLGMLSTGLATVSTNTTSPNYNATSENQFHGSPLTTRGEAGYEVWAELLDEGGTVLQSQRLTTVAAYSQYEFGEHYISGESSGGGGGNTGISSVTGDTLIKLADGSSKRADEIDGDDWLLVWDEKKNKLVSTQIAAKRERWVHEIYVVKTKERTIKVSDTHGFYLDNNVEIKVQDLVAGESEIYIYTDEGTLVKSLVLQVEHIKLTGTDTFHVLSFSTPPYLNYISDDILSHNYVTYPWEYQAPTVYSATNGSISSTNITRNFTFDQGSITYKVRYKWRGFARAGAKNDTGASIGSTTQVSVSMTSNASYASGLVSLPSTVTISVPTNITEITGKGIQVLSGTNEYVTIERGEASKHILKLAGGNLLFGYSGDGSGAGQFSIRPAVNNYYNLGTNSLKWRYIYSNNSLQTSDRAQKKNILESDLGLTFINSLNPVRYQWLSDEDDSPYHYGLIAQDVNKIVSKDDVAIIHEDDGTWNMAYNELISPMIKSIQELSNRVKELEARISGSL